MGMSENRAQRAVLERLFALQDTKYRAFQSKLMPTVAPETVIGVRTPLLRNLAKELAGTAEAADFLRVLPHAYYEENNLHAFLVEKIRDYDAALACLERAYAEREGSLMFLDVYPDFDPLRADPRFRALAARVPGG